MELTSSLKNLTLNTSITGSEILHTRKSNSFKINFSNYFKNNLTLLKILASKLNSKPGNSTRSALLLTTVLSLLSPN